MLRGAIDLVHPHRIGGWLHSGLGAVAERTVLAFVDGVCVGSGRVDRMREDLRRAGLGDGPLGFSFPIHVADEADLPRVVVKLEGSDLALLQPGARIARRPAGQPILAEPRRIEWLGEKGLLAPSELTFFKVLHRLGVADQTLAGPRDAAGTADARATAQNLFDLMALRPVDLQRIEMTARHAGEIVAAVKNAGGAPLSAVAIHAREAGAISVVEGSHAVAVRVEGLEGAIDHHFGPDRLLFLDWNARFDFQDGKAADLAVFVAV